MSGQPAFDAARPTGVRSTRRSACRSRARRCSSSTTSSATRRTTPSQAGRGQPRDAGRLHVQGVAQLGPTSSTTRSSSSSPRRPPRDPPRRSSRSRTPRQRSRRASTPTGSSRRSSADPNQGMEAVRKIERYADECDLKCVGAFPAGLIPAGRGGRQEDVPDLHEVRGARHRVRLDDGRARAAHPVRTAGRRAASTRSAGSSPSCKFVTRHGCEPWTDLAVKLLLKWPNLYYSTTAFAPKHYPKDIIDYANTRGADKIIWSGLLPRRPHLRPDLLRAARTCRSATTSGRSSCTRTRPASSSSTPERDAHGPADRHPRHRDAEHRADPVRGDVLSRPRRRGAAPRSRADVAWRERSRHDPRLAVREPRPRPAQSIGDRPQAPRGAETVLGSASRADVLIEGFRPGVAERLGIGPDRVPRPQPAARVRPDDRVGPGRPARPRRRPRHQLHRARRRARAHRHRGRPARCRRSTCVGDFGGGGLAARDRHPRRALERGTSGKGQVIDAAMIDGAAHADERVRRPRRDGLLVRRTRHEPARRRRALLRRVRDVRRRLWISIASYEPQFYAELLRLLAPLGFDDLEPANRRLQFIDRAVPEPDIGKSASDHSRRREHCL